MKWHYIIIHHSLTKDGRTVSWQAIRRYHKNWAYEGNTIKEKDAKALIAEGKSVKHPSKDIEYHYGIELVNSEYEVITGRMLDEVGNHTGGRNHDSIGICMIGNFDIAPPSLEQWKLLIKLCKSLSYTFNIVLSNIQGHCDFSEKSCPGKLFDMQRLRDDIARSVIGYIVRSDEI